jgi:hypothetical protein
VEIPPLATLAAAHARTLLNLSPAMKVELRRHARAYLRGFLVPRRQHSFNALVRRGLVVSLGLDLVTPAGWSVVAPLLDHHDQETAGFLATGGYVLRRSR